MHAGADGHARAATGGRGSGAEKGHGIIKRSRGVGLGRGRLQVRVRAWLTHAPQHSIRQSHVKSCMLFPCRPQWVNGLPYPTYPTLPYPALWLLPRQEELLFGGAWGLGAGPAMPRTASCYAQLPPGVSSCTFAEAAHNSCPQLVSKDEEVGVLIALSDR